VAGDARTPATCWRLPDCRLLSRARVMARLAAGSLVDRRNRWARTVWNAPAGDILTVGTATREWCFRDRPRPAIAFHRRVDAGERRSATSNGRDRTGRSRPPFHGAARGTPPERCAGLAFSKDGTLVAATWRFADLPWPDDHAVARATDVNWGA
jgi:hypothetical protein